MEEEFQSRVVTARGNLAKHADGTATVKQGDDSGPIGSEGRAEQREASLVCWAGVSLGNLLEEDFHVKR